jgi:hypothetical protein
VRYSEPQAFYTVMLGPRSWLFNLVALLYGLMAILGSLYIFRTLRFHTSHVNAPHLILSISFPVLMIAGIVFAMPYHLEHVPFLSRLIDTPINPLGKMQPNKYFAIAALVLFGLVNWIILLRSFGDRSPWKEASLTRRPDRLNQTILIVVAGCAMITMLGMGWVRETARAYNGYLIYGQISFSEERRTYERLTDE